MGLKFARTRPPSCGVSGPPVDPPVDPPGMTWTIAELALDYDDAVSAVTSIFPWNVMLFDLEPGGYPGTVVLYGGDHSPLTPLPPVLGTSEIDEYSYLTNTSAFGAISRVRCGIDVISAPEDSTVYAIFSQIVGTSDSVIQIFTSLADPAEPTEEIRITGIDYITDVAYADATDTYWVSADGNSGAGVYEVSKTGVPTGNFITITDAQVYNGVAYDGEHLWLGYSESGHHYIRRFTTSGVSNSPEISLDTYIDLNDVAIGGMTWRDETVYSDGIEIGEIDIIATKVGSGLTYEAKLIRVTLNVTPRELASYTYVFDGRTASFTNTSVTTDPDVHYQWYFAGVSDVETTNAVYTHNTDSEYTAGLMMTSHGLLSSYSEIVQEGLGPQSSYSDVIQPDKDPDVIQPDKDPQTSDPYIIQPDKDPQ